MTTSSAPVRANGRRLRVTDIARLAGTSQSTVSKVINGRADVAEDTRRRVQAVLDEVGFRKKLVTTKVSNRIEFVTRVFDANGSFPLLQGLLHWARQESLDVGITELGREGEYAADAITHVIDGNPYGVVMQLSSASEKDRGALRSRGIPVVVIDPVNGNPSGDLTVSIDNWTGGLLAARHLTGLGHTRIGIIAGPESALSSTARIAGFEQGLREAGVTMPDELRRSGDFDATEGYRTANELLTLNDPPTAMFALNDLMAVGVYKAAAEHGLRIPDDLSVVGFDDIFPAAYLGPGLTTVNQSFDDMARKAIDMIVRTRRGTLTDTSVVLPVRLTVRQSTTAPRG
ncbi:LacI family transcriptional regulator [Bifidobacterium sp. DSM 109958]|uniref:LacI family transcriptional regulator n=1 Tax=Bifidobacterium moraviense TaxID=2675323 RepID=A0A7Y0F1K2_9BIFI|nr:LacI family DNA-binding transcriptional regulator [Bifidobacterium sp. DSM 109958]NMN00330.1 LacI family transcriptional regulator [Bifidobacterium sp. DSM 109958]